jgi:hypothetical protein
VGLGAQESAHRDGFEAKLHPDLDLAGRDARSARGRDAAEAAKSVDLRLADDLFRERDDGRGGGRALLRTACPGPEPGATAVSGI